MSVNKVVYGDDTLIDLSADTVSPSSLLNGYTAHSASGTAITGTTIVNPRYGIFDISMCDYEQNITSHENIGYAGCRITVSSDDSSAVHFNLDPSKTYNISWWANNCGLVAFNSSWRIVFSEEDADGPHARRNVTEIARIYIYINPGTVSNQCEFHDLTIVEV